jgi:SAM-dependent methyltransferase
MATVQSAGLPNASFDLVTARLVLVNVPHPEQIVSEAAALTRPGGSVAFHEIDWAAMVCDPPNQAWNTFFELLVTFMKENGNDLFIGRKVPRLMRDAGLVELRVNAITHVHPPGDERRHLLLDFADNLRETHSRAEAHHRTGLRRSEGRVAAAYRESRNARDARAVHPSVGAQAAMTRGARDAA